jgi:phosphomannomutase
MPADATVMARLRAEPPTRLAGFDVTVDDLSIRRGQLGTDAVILSGGDADTSIRVVVRPSGTEPKVKWYFEVRRAPSDDVEGNRALALALRDDLVSAATRSAATTE